MSEYCFTETAFPGCVITCQIIPMGKDYAISVFGGSLPHIGSAVLSQARPSLTGSGISATSSVLNVVGHRDEAIARLFAEKMAIQGNCTAVCSCGIHMDSLTEEQLDKIQACCRKLLDRSLSLRERSVVIPFSS